MSVANARTWIDQFRGGSCVRFRLQRGVTLFEIMITVFVLSIGLLGIAALQGRSKNTNYEAVQRTTAGLLAQDIIERMRANPAGLASYRAAALRGETITTAPDCTAGEPCTTPADLATYDLHEWERAIDGVAEESSDGGATGGLVSPTGCISGPVGGGAGTYTVAIAWRGLTALTNPTTNACGEDSGLYGANDKFRRVLAIDTYISP
jgi:type IV pilus assembly protein PilV